MNLEIPLRVRWKLHRALRRLRRFGRPSAEEVLPNRPHPGGAPPRVLILGAGLAGLAAAYQLARRGYEVAVLEAQDHPGGRTLTLREPCLSGQPMDAGGFRFRDDHELVSHYVRQFRLAFEPFYPFRGEMIGHFGGQLRRRKRGQPIEPGQFPRPLTVDELWMLAQEREAATYRIRGGADLLPKEFATRLPQQIRYGCAVVRIEHEARGVRAIFQRGGSMQTLAADRLICALPFSVLRHIEICPAFSTAKRRVIEQLPYASASLVYLRVRHGFLSQQGLSGFAVSDTAGEIWHPSFDQPGPSGILISYTKGALAQKLGAMPEHDRLRSTLERMEAVFPGVGSNFEAGTCKFWDQDPWARGAQSWTWSLEPVSLPELSRPEGRVHFAGEHTSMQWPGWMEGAIESGHRAAQEVAEAVRAGGLETGEPGA